jgi:WD40 repeat protein
MIQFNLSHRARFVLAAVAAAVAAVCSALVLIPVATGRSPFIQAPAPTTAPAASPHLLNLAKVNLAFFSPDGQMLVTVSDDDHQVHFWSAQNGEEANRFGVAVAGAIMSASGNRVMTWGDDQVARIFDARTGKALRRLQEMNEPLRAAALSADGMRALTCAAGQSTITLWDAQSGRALGTLEGHAAPVIALAFSPDGTHAASLSGEPVRFGVGIASTTRPATAPADISLRVWDLKARKSVNKFDLPSPGRSLSFSSDGKLVLVTMNSASKIFDLAAGTEISAAPRSPQENFPAGELTADRKTGLWKAIGSASITNAATGENLRPLERPIEGLPICHAFSEDGARVILGTGKVNFFSRNPNEPGSVYVYDVATGKRLAKFTGHAREVTQVAISADGARAMSRDSDKALFLWAMPK